MSALPGGLKLESSPAHINEQTMQTGDGNAVLLWKENEDAQIFGWSRNQSSVAQINERVRARYG